jgi:FrmR/RcnR family transcriptional regulator, repressor of frmRAB operon
MSHTIVAKKKLLARARRIRGQIEAIERALEGESGCETVMHLIAGVRGSVSGLMAEVVEDHVRTHLVDADSKRDALQSSATDQLIEIVHSYLR